MLIAIIGKMGAGKTLFMTYLAYITAISQKKNIISNYQLNFNLKEDKTKYSKFSIDKLMSEEFENCRMFLDELYVYLESRDSGNDVNLIMSYLLFQSRKLDVDIFFTAQLISTIDKRYRNLVDVYVLCENLDEYFKYTIITKDASFPIYVKREKLKFLFPLYNTKELVKSERVQKIRDKYLDENSVDVLVNECLPFYREFKEEFPKSKNDRKFIGFFCKRKGYPQSKIFIETLFRKIENGALKI